MSIIELKSEQERTTETHPSVPNELVSHETYELCSDFSMKHPTLYNEWEVLHSKSPQARIDQHPEYILLEVSRYESDNRAGILIAHRKRGSLERIACLIPHRVSSRSAGTSIGHFSLNGYRLAGKQFLSETEDQIETSLLTETLHQVKFLRGEYLLIEDLDVHSSLYQQITQEVPSPWKQFYPGGLQQRHRLIFPDEAETYWKKFSSKSRYNFRRGLRLFGDVEIKKITEERHVPEFLELANTISQKSWQANQFGLRIQNNDYELRMFSLLARLGALRSYILCQKSVPVAFIVGTQYNNEYHYEEIAYDQDFRSLSPGTILLTQLIEDLIQDSTPEYIDFGGGTADYKSLFGTDISESGSVWVLAGNGKRPFRLGWLMTQKSMKHWIRQGLNKMGVKTKVRNFLRTYKRKKGQQQAQEGGHK